jgi:hypothetical protein
MHKICSWQPKMPSQATVSMLKGHITKQEEEEEEGLPCLIKRRTAQTETDIQRAKARPTKQCIIKRCIMCCDCHCGQLLLVAIEHPSYLPLAESNLTIVWGRWHQTADVTHCEKGKLA